MNFEKRRELEIPFLLKQLTEYKDPRVFDACLGSGATSIGLKLAGVEVVSNEIESDMKRIALSEEEIRGIALDITSHDWRELNGKYAKSFDAVLCLGNPSPVCSEGRSSWNRLDKYRFSGNCVYCGKEKVSARPIRITETMVVMEYRHEDGRKRHLVLYHFKSGEFKLLLEQAGFKDISVHGDYKPDFKPGNPEFLTYLCRKP